MTDDEIVALAVKAYGDAPLEFSPLTDDGDALRLAVKLRLVIDTDYNDETITINCSIGDDVRLYGGDDPQWDELGPGVAGYSVVVEDENCVVVPRVLTVEEASIVDDVVDWLDSLYAEAYVSKEYDY